MEGLIALVLATGNPDLNVVCNQGESSLSFPLIRRIDERSHSQAMLKLSIM